jgi:hypothetical protein
MLEVIGSEAAEDELRVRGVAPDDGATEGRDMEPTRTDLRRTLVSGAIACALTMQVGHAGEQQPSPL